MDKQRITVDEFAEVTFAAVLRALENRRLVPRGPIIYGIIWFPEPLSGAEAGRLGGAAKQR
jgi:hypothetical protein